MTFEFDSVDISSVSSLSELSWFSSESLTEIRTCFPTTCFLSRSEGESVDSCSKQPQSKAEWKACCQREETWSWFKYGDDIFPQSLLKTFIVFHSAVDMNSDRNLWTSETRAEREVQTLAPFSAPHSRPVTESAASQCWTVSFTKLH